MDKLKMHSPDLSQDNIAKIRELFPGCVTEARDDKTGKLRLAVDFDQLRQAPVQTLPEALAYCGSIDYLNARAIQHERLAAHGIAVLDALPSEFGAELVSRYLSWKKAGTL